MKIDGKAIADEIISCLKKETAPNKIFAAILVGDSAASQSFLKQKEKIAKELGVDFRIYKLSPELGNDGLRREVGRIAKQSRVGGVLVQLPLPDGLNTRYILNAIPKGKDVDALSEHASERVLAPSVEVVREIVNRTGVSLANYEVVVLGKGRLVGGPIAEWLEGKCRKLSVIDEGDSREPLKSADLIVSGVGKAGVLDAGLLKSGAGVIDFGYDMGAGDLAGDVGKLAFYTPTPGGTGPILVAKLMGNFYTLCRSQLP